MFVDLCIGALRGLSHIQVISLHDIINSTNGSLLMQHLSKRIALLYATAANFLTFLFLTQVTCPYNIFFCLLHSSCYILCRNCLVGVQKLKITKEISVPRDVKNQH